MELAPPPFRFSARRTRIDWQTLHGVDIQRLVRQRCPQLYYCYHALTDSMLQKALTSRSRVAQACQGMEFEENLLCSRYRRQI